MKGVVPSPVFIYNGVHMVSQRKGQGPQGRMRESAGSQEEGFLKAFEEYAGPLFRHASIRLSDRERAIELVHDTFTKAWGYLRDGHRIASFRPFLYKVLGNLVIDEYRRAKETSLDALLAAGEGDEGAFADLRDEPLERLIDALDAQRVLPHLSALPEPYRECLIVRYVDGLGPQEIAELIEESENVVSVRIHRGMKLLKARVTGSRGHMRGTHTQEN